MIFDVLIELENSTFAILWPNLQKSTQCYLKDKDWDMVLYQLGLDRTGYMSFLTGQDRTHKFDWIRTSFLSI